MKNRTVAILSGGIDSTTLVYDLMKQGDEIFCLSFDYGQKHKKELEYAKRICKKLKLKHKIVDISNIHKIVVSQNSLTGIEEVPEGHYADEIMKKTVVPYRNSIMLIIAAGLASTLDYNRIAYAAHAGNHAIYPDCRPEFVEAMKILLEIGDYKKIKLYAPYINISKTDIVKKGLSLNIPYKDTWSCYKGKELPCGKCGTCIERLEAFRDVGIVDPLKYEE